jgi:hypothetical protein
MTGQAADDGTERTMRILAVVSGAARPSLDRRPGRLPAFLEVLGSLGAVDVVVVHDRTADVATRRGWWSGVAGAEPVADGPAGVVGVERVVEVAAPALPRSGFLREVHLGRSDAPERAARATAWFRVVDAFVASSPAPHDLVWCADVASLTRAGWLRPAVPAAVDIDRCELLGSERARRAVRRTAAPAHLVTMGSEERRAALGLPGSVVVDSGATGLAPLIVAVVASTAAYRPVRTS